jgi:hypothetical protein
MENIYFNLHYINIEQMLINLTAFVITSACLLYLIDLILTKFLYRSSKQRKELSLRLSFLWAIVVYFILFNIYIFILFYRFGLDNFNFLNGMFYLGFMAQLVVYLGLIILFFIKRYTLNKIINEKSIN